ncbi:class I SAM-dependent rRNA methyltransferase [Lentibacter algarum]|uniref:RSP_2647 family RNA methyltransferase n=1 Tax=Lentibacter algarum TaxID=576131 RepID=UPI001C079F0A|nr:class I SAM-dependent rRNA methyltransferase [Lentibacter algarum]MBU2980833.1 class I SAM-dependent rRNA methyltransferase [Lentibacter algarum]
MTTPPYPVLRLKPKADARKIRHGAPWVFDNELVLDRRSKNIPAGAIALLEDNDHAPLGLVGVNTGSRITGRMLERDANIPIDTAWFQARLTRALALRERLYDAPFYRLVHAESDGLPGVVIDRFGDTVVLQPNAAWAEVKLPELTEALLSLEGVTTVLKNAGGRARGLEGLDDVNAVLAGKAPDAPLPVVMNGATYMADLTGGQKTGLFYDQRDNHAFAAKLAQGADVLDVFSHVGGFALAALANGAASALAVDGSAAALELAAAGAKASGTGDKFETLTGDAFDTLASLGAEGRKFDVVVCDPPAFAPNKKALDAGLRAYERIARLAAGLVKDGGYLVVCSCSHAADLAKFRAASSRGIGRAGRQSQLLRTGFAGPDHPLMPQLAESGYLKALYYRL